MISCPCLVGQSQGDKEKQYPRAEPDQYFFSLHTFKLNEQFAKAVAKQHQTRPRQKGVKYK